jgi:hypothetical protein
MGHLILILAASAASGAVWHRWSVRRHPYAPCRRCGRSGRNAGSNGRRWGSCRLCGGSGKRLRWGARPT